MTSLSDRVIREAERISEKSVCRKNLGFALGDLLDIDSTTKRCVVEVLTVRKQLAPELITSLLLSSFQYLNQKDNVPNDSFMNMEINEWKVYIENAFSENGSKLKRLLQRKNIQLYIVNRYFPLKVLSRIAFGNSPISILDIGCSLNFGLATVSKDNDGEQFKGIKLNKLPPQLYSGKTNLEYGLGIDLDKPNANWIKACIWPEIPNKDELIQKIDTMLNDKTMQVDFRKIDALKIMNFPELTKRFNIIITSAVMNQLPPNSQNKFITNISTAIKDDGFLLVNDYHPEANANDPFSYSTDIYPFKGGNIQKALNILKADSPFYNEVIAGTDFQMFVDNFSLK